MSSPQADHSPKTADYQNDFLRILNNRAKEKGPKNEARSRGFVVIVPGATSLTPLQTLCFDGRQTYNHCFTARYRLRPSAPVGTLLLAFIDDLIKVSRGEKVTAGDLRAGKTPADSPFELKRFAEHFLERMNANLHSILEAKNGTLETSQLAMLSEAFKSESLLTRGNRLVLFGEIAEEAATASEWQAIAGTLFAQLPERVGLVLSGVPKDFVIPRDDPHFLEITLPKTDGVAADAQGLSLTKFTDSSFHTDEPASNDQLDVTVYANAIARFILHPQTTAPLTLGINGPWGKGKSSFMKLVRDELVKCAKINRTVARSHQWNELVVNLTSPNPGGKEGLAKEELQREQEEVKTWKDKFWEMMKEDAQKNVLSVTFNAWQFEDAKQTWAGLASQISETIEKSLPWTSRQALKVSYAWKERQTELILTLLLPLAIVLMVVGLISTGFFAKLDIKPEGLGVLLPVGSTFLAAWFASSQLLKVAVPISERVLSYTRMPNYREQMGFQHRVKDDLRFIYDFLIKHRDDCRVVVFIDDLDRCSENKIMELLQAINLILGSSRFFVFVGMDTEMIHRAIKSHYKDTPDGFPDSYLQKIVQISFYLPETMSDKLADYVSTLFSVEARAELARQTNVRAGGRQLEERPIVGAASGLPFNLTSILPIAPVVTKDAEDTADELEAFRDYSVYLGDNPRVIKRLVNVHRLVKILVQKESALWLSERQRKLVKWLIFCERWPGLVDDVLKQRNELDEREAPKGDGKLGGDIFSDLATTPAGKEGNLLRKFAAHSGNGGKHGPNGTPPMRDVLLFKDIDEQFRSAAKFFQLIVESSAADPKKEKASNIPTGGLPVRRVRRKNSKAPSP